MPPFYVTTQGAKLRLRRRRLIVEHQARGADKPETLASVPLVHVDQVIVFGNVGLTTPLMSTLMRRDVPLVFLTVDGRYKGRLIGAETGFGQLRLNQYNHAQEPEAALRLARSIVYGKLRNQRALLLRYGRRKADGVLSDSADRVGALAEQARRCQTLDSLRGCEGKAGAIYFGVFKRLLKGPWAFEKRVRRPPTDPVNVLLSFGYTLLLHTVRGAISTVGLDAYVGFLHGLVYNRPSLALDMMEAFRPLVVDSVVMRCLNNQILRTTHFVPQDDPARPILLDDEGRARFIRELEARLTSKFHHPASDERVSYRRCIELQVRELARVLRDGGDYRPFIVR